MFLIVLKVMCTIPELWDKW